MALFPIPPEPTGGQDSETGELEPVALDEGSLRALRGFFELLDKWDRQNTPGRSEAP